VTIKPTPILGLSGFYEIWMTKLLIRWPSDFAFFLFFWSIGVRPFLRTKWPTPAGVSGNKERSTGLAVAAIALTLKLKPQPVRTLELCSESLLRWTQGGAVITGDGPAGNRLAVSALAGAESGEEAVDHCALLEAHRAEHRELAFGYQSLVTPAVRAKDVDPAGRGEPLDGAQGNSLPCGQFGDLDNRSAAQSGSVGDVGVAHHAMAVVLPGQESATLRRALVKFFKEGHAF